MNYSLCQTKVQEIIDIIHEADDSKEFLPSKADADFSVYKFFIESDQNIGIYLFALKDDHGLSLGFISLIPDKVALHAHIGPMYIRRQYRGLSLGKIQVQEIIEWCKNIGVKKLSSKTWGSNLRSRKIFEELGFTIYDERLGQRINGDSTVKYSIDI